MSVKKVLRVLGSVFTTIILAFTIFVMIFTIVSFNTVGADKGTFLGYKPNIVVSDSMQGVFNVGDIAVSKTVDTAALTAGDVITFRSIDPVSYDEIITHQIVKVGEYRGELAFYTMGTTTGVEDPYPVPATNVLGKYVFHIPKMGYFFEFLKSPTGYFTLILIPFLLLIGTQAIKFVRLIRQYRTEQQEELEAQRSEMEAERLKAQEMMDELARLRAQLGDSPEEKPAAAPAPVSAELTAESTVNETEGE